ncbi:MAG: S8/S53 family peptidase [Myxococcota bacterium]
MMLLLSVSSCDSLDSTNHEAEAAAAEAEAVSVEAVKTEAATVEAAPRPRTRARALPSREVSLSETTARRRYVALMNAGVPCPQVNRWNERPLFRLTADATAAWGALEASGTPMPPALERFCVYTWGGAGSPAAKPVVPGSVRVDIDPDVVVPQAPSLTAGTALEQARSQRLLEQLGATPRASQAPSGSPYATRTTGLAFVAVVDTADSTVPTGVGSPLSIPGFGSWNDRHQHGLTMASIIESARCPNGQTACRSRQFFAQAFPYPPGQVVPAASAGQMGSLGSLASALGESVARWRVLPASEDSPLVINMSLGWDQTHGGNLPANHAALLDVAAPNNVIPAPVQAVHNALAYASCQGSLAIAAAGNSRGQGCEQTGALAPAAWESLNPLTPSECNQYFGLEMKGVSTLPQLVYGAGGLDEGGNVIANSRMNSIPARALYAHQASVEVGSSHTQPWTGTSVSSAGLAALAAQVWTHRPSETARQVLGRIDTRGTTMTLASTWRQSTSVKTKRIRFNSVMSSVAGSQNPYGSTVTSGNPVSTAITTYVNSQPQPYSPSAEVTLGSRDPGSASNCGPLQVELFGAPGSATLPGSSAATDESRPQPHVPICPNCPIINETNSGGSGTQGSGNTASPAPLTISYKLYMRLDTAYSGATISQPVLTLDDSATNTSMVVALAPQSGAWTYQVVELDDYTLPNGQTLAAWVHGRSGVRSGRLSFSVSVPNMKPQTVTQVIDVVR